MTKRRKASLRLDALEDRAVPATLSNFLTHQHVDLNFGFTGGPSGVWSLQPRDDDNVLSYAPDDAVLYVGTNAQTSRTAGSDFDFIGVNSGDTYYKLPATQDPNLLFLGTAGYGIAAGSLDRHEFLLLPWPAGDTPACTPAPDRGTVQRIEGVQSRGET